jgi:hypothetical protein
MTKNIVDKYLVGCKENYADFSLGMGIGSLVLVLFISRHFWIYPLIIGIAAIVSGLLGLYFSNTDPKIKGRIASIIGIVLGAFSIILFYTYSISF